MRIPYPNAFTTNSLGLVRDPLPLGVSCNHHTNGIWSLYLYPQAVVDLADLVEAYAAEWVVLFKAGVHRYVEVTSVRELTLAEIATADSVPHQESDANVISIACHSPISRPH